MKPWQLPKCNYCGRFVNPRNTKEVSGELVYGMFSVDREIYYHIKCKENDNTTNNFLRQDQAYKGESGANSHES
jgi:hypothetical protein